MPTNSDEYEYLSPIDVLPERQIADRVVAKIKGNCRKPVLRRTQLSVEFVVGLMADGWQEADIVMNYPGITRDDVMACLAYARVTLSSEKVSPAPPDMRFLAGYRGLSAARNSGCGMNSP